MTSTGNLRFLRHGEAGQEQPAVLNAAGDSFSLLPLTRDIVGDFLNAEGIARTRQALADGALPAARLDGRRIGLR
jgi:2,4-didehydro-3-deoxy-L-rhamnonate hydrolase